MLFYINHCIRCGLDDKIQSIGLVKVLLMLLNSVVNNFEGKKEEECWSWNWDCRGLWWSSPQNEFHSEIWFRSWAGLQRSQLSAVWGGQPWGPQSLGCLHILTLKKGWCSWRSAWSSLCQGLTSRAGEPWSLRGGGVWRLGWREKPKVVSKPLGTSKRFGRFGSPQGLLQRATPQADGAWSVLFFLPRCRALHLPWLNFILP